VRINASEKITIPCYYLRLEIDILRGAADFQEAVSKICFPHGETFGPRR
jgi:tetraacyldisaccharide 4'-kinase